MKEGLSDNERVGGDRIAATATAARPQLPTAPQTPLLPPSLPTAAAAPVLVRTPNK